MTCQILYFRIHIFKAFWITHKLFYILYLLILLHGASRIIQEPFFHYYFLAPAILFLIDKTISLSMKKKALEIISAELLPSGEWLLESFFLSKKIHNLFVPPGDSQIYQWFFSGFFKSKDPMLESSYISIEQIFQNIGVYFIYQFSTILCRRCDKGGIQETE